MARVTVEDCVVKIPNRFELVVMAAQRARNISAGAALTLERSGDKNPVVALREIAEDTVPLEELQEAVVKSLQTYVEMDEPEEEEMDEPAIRQELSSLPSEEDEDSPFVIGKFEDEEEDILAEDIAEEDIPEENKTPVMSIGENAQT